MSKIIILNASPRKNGNTAKMLKEAMRGAEDSNIEVEYINLVDLNYKGCMSCFSCKLKNNKTNGLCVFKDDLRPILEKILSADALIIGTPIYFSNPTGMFRNLVERLLFPIMTYLNTDNPNHFYKLQIEKKLPVALIYTMNCPEDKAPKLNYPIIFETDKRSFESMFGYCEILTSYNTYQFPDYSKYLVEMSAEKIKADIRNNQFPKDLQKAYELGKRLILMK